MLTVKGPNPGTYIAHRRKELRVEDGRGECGCNEQVRLA